MLKVIIIYVFIAIISFIVGLNMGINNAKSGLDRRINCEGEVCPPPEGYDVRDR